MRNSAVSWSVISDKGELHLVNNSAWESPAHVLSARKRLWPSRADVRLDLIAAEILQEDVVVATRQVDYLSDGSEVVLATGCAKYSSQMVETLEIAKTA